MIENTYGLKFGEYADHQTLERCVHELEKKHKCLSVGSIGSTILGRTIPEITIGSGDRCVLYIGAHHGMEWITSALLLLLAAELADAYESDRTVSGVSVRAVLKLRRICIVPMLNPDGVEYAIHGLDPQSILHDRVIAMNGGDDLSHWQANARGVDLNHNYNAGFAEYKQVEAKLGIWGGAPTRYSGEYPESEPETRSMCNFVRFLEPTLAVSLHTQGEEIYYTSCGKSEHISLPLARAAAKMTGYKLAKPTGTAAYGGFTDWFINEFQAPALTLECGRGTNPLPLSDLLPIYSRLHRALITLPTLV